MWEAVEYDGKKYNDVCYRSSEGLNESSCQTSYYPLQFFLKQDASFDETMLTDLVSEINDGKGTTDYYPLDSFNYINIENMFGDTTPSDAKTDIADGTNNIEKAEAIHWRFYTSREGISQDFLTEFEKQYEEYAYNFNEQSHYISVYPMLSTSLSRASDEAINKDMSLLFIGISLIVAYSLFVLGELNTFRSRLVIAIVGVISVGLAYIETIGFGAYIGIHGNAYVNVVPFLMIGIGVDDMYVLIAALKEAPKELTGEEKMQYMMKYAGVSVTITSLTNFGAFTIGSITAIPAIHDFCLYAAFGMLFDYFNQMTVFSALLAYDIRRSERPLGDCCGLVFCKPDSRACCSGKYTVTDDGNIQESLSQRLIYRVFSKFLMKNSVRLCVCVLFLGLLALNIYGLTQLEVNFLFVWLVTDESEVYQAIEIQQESFDTAGITIGFYSLHSEFTTSEVQTQLETLGNEIENCSSCEEDWIISGSTDSWYSSFKAWVSQGDCEDTDGSTVTLVDGYIAPATFHYCLKEFQATAEGLLYSSRLAWEDDKLVAAAIQADLIFLETVAERTHVLVDTREIADSGPAKTYAYSSEFLWYEHSVIFEQETILQISCALGLIFIVALLTSADLIGAFIILLMVSLTVVGQIATVYFWGENLNALSMVNSVMGIGVAVDYSAHYLHAFKSCQERTKKKKARRALRSIGVSIFNGGASTFLAIAPMFAAKSYAFTMLLKCWFPLVLYGLGHALILLPVVLSFTGVTPLRKSDESSQESNSESLPKPDKSEKELEDLK